MHWQTVFTVENGGGPGDYVWAVMGAAFAVVGAGLAVYRERSGVGSRSLFRRGFGVFFCIFALGWTALFAGGTYLRHASQIHALRSGGAAVAEGNITNFHPMPENGHGSESFDVGNQHFEYSDNVITGGFNETSTLDGGPIHAGERVRITSLDGVIIKLQLAE